MKNIKIDFNTATALVIANMIGTGVFTSLGYQVINIESGFSILMLWVIGGIIALCGALVYGEIGSAFPQSGGEYNYLSKLYHPAIGFLSGWVSVTVGFAAPIAAAAVALGMYVNKIFPGVHAVTLSVTVVLLLTAMHATDLKLGSTFQKIFTVLKVTVIVFFIGAGFFSHPTHEVNFMPQSFSWNEIISAPFAISLVFVSYAYSGWNASSYIAGELDNPQKNLPKSLLIGTGAVMLLYVGLNSIFMYTVSVNELKGFAEVGYLSAAKIFGSTVGAFMGLVIALLLVSTLSAMILTGPRVMRSMGNDMTMLSFFTTSNKKNVPYVAVIFQSVIALILILTSSFSSLITYVGFTLSLCTFLTVAGIFILRTKFKTLETKYKTWGYPITPIIFLASTGWVMFFIFKDKPTESLYGLGTVLSGLVVYFIGSKKEA
ncbi:MAG TPA: amino acid permease [Bacteroidia bacterium]|jgi:APA family basic amino acid/polyamine antiporter|nr:amino acid permease [Bacteroidia bacterium]